MHFVFHKLSCRLKYRMRRMLILLFGLLALQHIAAFILPLRGLPMLRASARLSLAGKCSEVLQRDLTIFNTLKRRKERFVPIESNAVSFYSCGPTVYDYAHVGNFRAFLMYDTIKRWLQYCGYKVEHVCNLTDVDDKIIAKMLRERKTLKEITQRYIDAFFSDLSILNIVPARAYPRATDYIPAINEMVKELVETEHAYVSNSSVYFRVKSFPSYGAMSNVKLGEVRHGGGESGPHQRKGLEGKEHEGDFALWKGSSPEDAGVCWGSAYGPGRPGWHIECSAMCRALLGDAIDLHAGGVDLIFPHHENEIAQTEALTGKQFSRYWMHNGFVNIDNKKMSKSLQNFKTLRDVVHKPEDARAFRYMMVTAQYRSALSFTEETYAAAKRSLRRIDKLVQALESVAGLRLGELAKSNVKPRDGDSDFKDADADLSVVPGALSSPVCRKDDHFLALCDQCLCDFEGAMCDDLNTPRATSALFELVAASEKCLHNAQCSARRAAAALEVLGRMNEVYGVFYDVPTDYFFDGSVTRDQSAVPEEVIALAERRSALKAQKNYAEADELRKSILALGYAVMDTLGNYNLEKL